MVPQPDSCSISSLRHNRSDVCKCKFRLLEHEQGRAQPKEQSSRDHPRPAAIDPTSASSYAIDCAVLSPTLPLSDDGRVARRPPAIGLMIHPIACFPETDFRLLLFRGVPINLVPGGVAAYRVWTVVCQAHRARTRQQLPRTPRVSRFSGALGPRRSFPGLLPLDTRPLSDGSSSPQTV